MTTSDRLVSALLGDAAERDTLVLGSIQCGDVVMNDGSSTALIKNGLVGHLTCKEFELIRLELFPYPTVATVTHAHRLRQPAATNLDRMGPPCWDARRRLVISKFAGVAPA